MELIEYYIKIKNVFVQLLNHFGKRQYMFVTRHVRNRVETRAQLKLKSIVTNDYIRRYFRYIDMFDKNKGYFSSVYDSADNESIIADNSMSNTG